MTNKERLSLPYWFLGVGLLGALAGAYLASQLPEREVKVPPKPVAVTRPA